MRHIVQVKNIRVTIEILFLTTGFIIGSMFFFMQKSTVKLAIADDLKQALLTVSHTELNPVPLLLQIAKIRFLEFGLFTLILTQKRKKAGILLLCWVFLAMLTSFFSMMCFSFGWKGIVIVLLCMFPHYLIYASFFCFVAYKVEKNGKCYLYQNHRTTSLCVALIRTMELLGMILFLLLGIMMECYSNLFLLKNLVPILIL